jgi:arylsulfatase A-like enzyme
MSQPNLLFLLTDNQRADLLGCAGNSILQTPTLDQMARRGVRFTNAFATTPICAASRASFLTGLYERRHGFTFKTRPLQPVFSDTSYPALLKAAGYRTGFIGKFGVATEGIEPAMADADALADMFDHFDNFEHWTSDGYEIPQPGGGSRHLTDITGDKAIDFIAAHRERAPTQPFCLSVSFNAPHAQDGDPRHYVWPAQENSLYVDAVMPEPVNADPAFFASLPAFIRESESRRRWHTRYDTATAYQRHLRGLYRMISGIDRNAGRILEALQRSSLLDNTVVIFASDHGMYYGERGLSDCWQLNEEPLRIPLIVSDLRQHAAGRESAQLALNIDVAPTLLELAGVATPGLMQGRSLVPLLHADDPGWRTEFFCEHLFDRADIPKSEGVRTDRWKYIRYFEQHPVYEELYDLATDPHESRNLASVPMHAARLAGLRRECTALRNAAGSPSGAGREGPPPAAP